MDEAAQHARELSVIVGRTERDMKDFLLIDELVGTSAIRNMNLELIKRHLRYFKDKLGQNGISTSVNKSGCVTQLENAVTTYRALMMQRLPLAQQEQLQNLLLQQKKDKQLRLEQQKQVARQQQQAQQQAQSKAMQAAQLAQQQWQQKHAAYQAQQRAKQMQQFQDAYRAPAPAVNSDAAKEFARRAAAINSDPKRLAVYTELMSTAGITQSEAMDGIDGATPEEMEDVVMLIYKIACKKAEKEESDEDESDDDDDDDDGDNEDEDDEEDGGNEERNRRRAAKEQRRSEKKARQELIERRRKEDEELQAQEDKDMDMAILNSEGERDVIQNRRKSRVTDIKNSCACLISDADEFKLSVIAGSNDSILKSSTLKVSSNGTQGEDPMISRTNSLRGKLGISEYPSESALVCEVVRFLDLQYCQRHSDFEASPSSSSSSSSSAASCSSSSQPSLNGSSRSIVAGMKNNSDYYDCCCPEHIKLFRAALVSLLLLEKLAMKFYKDRCLSYFLLLSRRLDAQNTAENFSDSLPFLSNGGDQQQGAELNSLDSGGLNGASTSRSSSSSCSSSSSSSCSSSSSSSSNDSSNGSIEEKCPHLKALSALSALFLLECEVLEGAMYAMSTDGNMIPKAFRDADPVEDQAGSYDLEDDGFELV